MILSDRFRYRPEFLKQCEKALNEAEETVPFYRSRKQYDPGSGATLDERYDSLPALTKADMRKCFPHGLMPDGKDLQKGLLSGEIGYTFTSGTTSEKVVNIWNQDWWNRSELASWKLNGDLSVLSWPQKQAKLASSLNVGINCEDDLPIGHRILGNTLYLNEKTTVLQWQTGHYERMVRELNEYRPVILEANPSLLARLSWWIADHDLAVFSPAVIVFTFEFPSVIHLSDIRKVFSSSFVSSYGSTEAGFVLEQDRSGRLIQNCSFCRIDFRPLLKKFGGPEIGRIYVTTFDNPWNKILKFDVGDLICLSPADSSPLSAEGMIAEDIEGRVGNVTFAADGSLVTTKKLDDAISVVSGLRDYHLTQHDGKNYELEALLSPGNGTADSSDHLVSVLENVYGKDGKYDIRILPDILPGPAGKFRRTETDFEFDEEALFQ